MLSLNDVVAGYGPLQVLRGVTLDVQQGDFVPASRASHSGTGPYPPYVEHDGQVPDV